MAGNKKENPLKSNLEAKIFRLIAMVLLALFLYLAYFVFLLLAAAQLFFFFVENKTNPKLQNFLDVLGRYIGQIYAYLGFKTEDAPFPFSKFPD